MKKKYIIPSTEVVKIQRIKLLLSSTDIFGDTVDIGFGGVDFGNGLFPE